jgi:threonine dehydrogenase-like Zn-dependent dehydrogenase
MLKLDGGRFVPIALYERIPEVDLNYVVRNEIEIRGSWTWNKEDFLRAIDLMKNRQVDRQALISHHFPLEETREAFEKQMQVDEAVKVMVSPRMGDPK